MSTSALKNNHCVPCTGSQPPLPRSESAKHLRKLRGWSFTSNKKAISLVLKMKNFMAAVQLIRRIAAIAEREDHHPDFHLTGYRNLQIELSTHAIGGLSLNDFILAAKIDALPKSLKK